MEDAMIRKNQIPEMEKELLINLEELFSMENTSSEQAFQRFKSKLHLYALSTLYELKHSAIYILQENRNIELVQLLRKHDFEKLMLDMRIAMESIDARDMPGVYSRLVKLKLELHDFSDQYGKFSYSYDIKNYQKLMEIRNSSDLFNENATTFQMYTILSSLLLIMIDRFQQRLTKVLKINPIDITRRPKLTDEIASFGKAK